MEIAHLAAHATFSKVNPLEVRNSTENDKTFSYIKDEKRRRLAGIFFFSLIMKGLDLLTLSLSYTYAGMVKALDESVERVVKALSDANMLDNSIIVFMSDNGAPSIGFLENSGSNYPLRGVR